MSHNQSDEILARTKAPAGNLCTHKSICLYVGVVQNRVKHIIFSCGYFFNEDS